MLEWVTSEDQDDRRPLYQDVWVTACHSWSLRVTVQGRKTTAITSRLAGKLGTWPARVLFPAEVILHQLATSQCENPRVFAQANLRSSSEVSIESMATELDSDKEVLGGLGLGLAWRWQALCLSILKASRSFEPASALGCLMCIDWVRWRRLHLQTVWRLHTIALAHSMQICGHIYRQVHLC